MMARKATSPIPRDVQTLAQQLATLDARLRAGVTGEEAVQCATRVAAIETVLIDVFERAGRKARPWLERVFWDAYRKAAEGEAADDS